MHTSDQSPEENQLPVPQSPDPYAQRPASEDDTIRPADQAEPETREDTISKTVPSSSKDEETTRQDPAYPPKPSFYEQALAESGVSRTPEPPVVGSVPTPPPARPAATSYETPVRQADAGNILNAPASGYQQPPAGYMPPPGYPAYPQGGYYPGIQPPPFMPAPPPAKKSRTWLWILIAALVVIIVASCGLCAWVGYSSFGGIYKQAYSAVVDGNQLVNDYYDSVQNKRYSQAYTYLSNGQSNDAFIAQATKQDNLYGPVLRYTVGQPQSITSSSGGTIDSFSIVVDVARQKKSYKANLQVKRINNQWKIVSFDQI
ncbi:hypothetical protein KDA_24220 [Dictyobacter alpinus]|uniref:DUF4878 domain-containing protein n=1 Tax=Dictyobacter alpinus TaxID=2014873 RepID=A0A402B6G3_9CHLR|nr:hypothetical protein [Dictyobacter alpinus]GCE26938.1 hypothetical protein KDA_24220 [Dictyobacter alpinus]